MTNEQKQQVKNALVRFVISFPTQSEASANLKGISPATISNVKNNNWDLISDQLWYNIARQVGYYSGNGWKPADTSVNLLLRILFGDAQRYKMTYGVAIGKGLGKTFTATQYRKEHEHIIYISCHERFTQRAFLASILNAEAIAAHGTITGMMTQIADLFTAKEEPLLILDDVHKLNSSTLCTAISLCNFISQHSGVIFMGNDDFRPKILNGIRLGKEGFEQLNKKIGRRFVTANSLNQRDIELVCRANGVQDEGLIQYISEESYGNLHNTNRMILQVENHSLAA